MAISWRSWCLAARCPGTSLKQGAAAATVAVVVVVVVIIMIMVMVAVAVGVVVQILRRFKEAKVCLGSVWCSVRLGAVG